MKKIATCIINHSFPQRECEWWAFLFLMLFFCSCHKETGPSHEELARRDSIALHVGVMPVADCLPFYLAERTGIYERLGLEVRLHTYQAQLDIDTALARGHVDVGYSDLARAILLQQDSVDVRAIATFEGRLDLITPRRGRVRKLDQLKEKMVAVARHSITDYWSDRLTDSAAIRRADIFRPQINDVRIRTDMLCNGTMDAAFLPEPYATEALQRGHHKNFSTNGLSPKLVVLLATGKALNNVDRQHQIELLLKGYTQAIARDAKHSAVRDSLPSILNDFCQTPDSLISRVIGSMPPFQPLSSPKGSDAEAALKWLQGRGKIKKGHTIDSLFSSKINID